MAVKFRKDENFPLFWRNEKTGTSMDTMEGTVLTDLWLGLISLGVR
jgi:hypothetical protein